MRAGKLRHPIVIEQNIGTEPDSVGQRKQHWQVFHECRADINPGTGKQFEAAKQTHSALTHLFTIRYCKKLYADGVQLSDMRVRHASKNRTFEILYALNFRERDREIFIYAQEHLH